jgi:hypothetical protein
MSRYENPNLNKWSGSEDTGVWEFRYYRFCYLTIRKLDNGMYKPVIGAIGNLEMPGVPLPKEKYHQFCTFKEAEQFLYKYVDYIRDVWDIEAKKALYARLHKLNPSVYIT